MTASKRLHRSNVAIRKNLLHSVKWCTVSVYETEKSKKKREDSLRRIWNEQTIHMVERQKWNSFSLLIMSSTLIHHSLHKDLVHLVADEKENRLRWKSGRGCDANDNNWKESKYNNVHFLLHVRSFQQIFWIELKWLEFEIKTKTNLHAIQPWHNPNITSNELRSDAKTRRSILTFTFNVVLCSSLLFSMNLFLDPKQKQMKTKRKEKIENFISAICRIDRFFMCALRVTFVVENTHWDTLSTRSAMRTCLYVAETMIHAKSAMNCQIFRIIKQFIGPPFTGV